METTFEKSYFEEIANKTIAKISEIDPRLSARYEDGFLIGSFRGKDRYKFSVASRQFIYNKGGEKISSVILKAIEEVSPVK